jgi:methionine-rich copper-binding protein CopC
VRLRLSKHLRFARRISGLGEAGLPPRNGSPVMGRLWVLVFFILLVSPSTVLPHASLIKSVPARRAHIFRSPPQIQLWFSERLEARFSSLRVIDSGGKRVDLGNVAVDTNDPKRISVGVSLLRRANTKLDSAYFRSMATSSRTRFPLLSATRSEHHDRLGSCGPFRPSG